MAAVSSVRNQSVAAEDIIVVIDYNPGLYEELTAALPDVMVVENRNAKGLSGARNTGFEVSSGEIIAFLDDDAWPGATGWRNSATGMSPIRSQGLGAPRCRPGRLLGRVGSRRNSTGLWAALIVAGNPAEFVTCSVATHRFAARCSPRLAAFHRYRPHIGRSAATGGGRDGVVYPG